MDRLRRHRRWLPAWLAALLVCAQLLTVAYACPRGPADAAAAAPAIPDCHASAGAAMDPEQPQLCKAHCEAGLQSVNSSAGAAALASAPALIDARWTRDLLRVAEADACAPPPAATRAPGPPAGSAPLYIALLVLRN